MSNATISNQNERTSAIFKTIGIYILTLLVLIIFMKNRSVGSEIVDKTRELEEDTANLNAMIQKMDTIASLTQILVELDEKDRSNIGTEQGKIEELTNRRKNFYSELYQIGKEPQLATAYDALSNINASLLYMQGRIKTHLDNIESQKKQYADDLSKQDLPQAERVLGLQQTIAETTTEHGKEVQKLDNQISQKDININNLNADLEELKKQLETVKTDVSTMVGYLRTELSKSKVITRWKPVVEELSKQVNTLSAKLE